MTAGRWEKIERTYREAAGRTPSQRGRFLDQACSADPDLRAEVERMLSGEGKLGGFLETPAAHLAARDLLRPRISPGASVGPYEILELVGAGGMGEVYKARDPRLNRLIALKVLAPDVLGDAERRKRLLREARTASSLNHPNIVTIHEISAHEGIDFIAMEYVSGKSLDQRIGDKGLPLGEALDYAVQIADALAAAHELRIVHRDLKPGNIMVTEQGRIKVLDFGLAKLLESTPGAEDAEESALTEPGMIIGTVGYMSPEQAKGQAADSRSDIFCFGAILYKMITGHPAFRGGTRVETLAAILQQDPKPAGEVVHDLPAQLHKILGRCLRKEPAQRFQHMGDVARLLEDVREEVTSGRAAPETVPAAAPVNRRRRAWPAAAVAMLAALGVAAVWRFGNGARGERGPIFTESARFTVAPPADSAFAYTPQVSPDGRRFVSSLAGRAGRGAAVYLHSLEAGSGQVLPGTVGGMRPYWSPDGKSILFTAGVELMKLDLSGGALPVSLGRGTTLFGADWNGADVILLGRYPGGIQRISATGGASRSITTLDPSHRESGHVFPRFLPGGNRFLYLAGARFPARARST